METNDQSKKQLRILLILIMILGIGILYVLTRNSFFDLTKYSFKKPNQTEVPITYPGLLKIESSAFTNGGEIPEKFTCKGGDINPPLSFSGVSTDAKSLVLIIEDPDAVYKVWTHWVLYNISPKTTLMYENFIPNGAFAGENDFGTDAYRGPCPPAGKHRYEFKLFSLSEMLKSEEGMEKEEVLSEMKNKILDFAQLDGTFGR